MGKEQDRAFSEEKAVLNSPRLLVHQTEDGTEQPITHGHWSQHSGSMHRWKRGPRYYIIWCELISPIPQRKENLSHHKPLMYTLGEVKGYQIVFLSFFRRASSTLPKSLIKQQHFQWSSARPHHFVTTRSLTPATHSKTIRTPF